MSLVTEVGKKTIIKLVCENCGANIEKYHHDEELGFLILDCSSCNIKTLVGHEKSPKPYPSFFPQQQMSTGASYFSTAMGTFRT